MPRALDPNVLDGSCSIAKPSMLSGVRYIPYPAPFNDFGVMDHEVSDENGPPLALFIRTP
jgi:hypothetical protein